MKRSSVTHCTNSCIQESIVNSHLHMPIVNLHLHIVNPHLHMHIVNLHLHMHMHKAGPVPKGPRPGPWAQARPCACAS